MKLSLRASSLLRKCLVTSSLFLCPLAGNSNGQILYNTLTNNGEQLRQVNLDGSNNIALQIGNLPQAANPTISRDGRFLAVRSSDPLRPNQFTTNLHVLDRATGQVNQITQLQDQTDADGSISNQTPRHSAFSPDGEMLAVTSFVNVSTNLQGASTVPFVSVYDVPEGTLFGGTTMLSPTDALSTVGVGISWSAATNLVALPLIAQNGLTAIFAQDENSAVQLTNPQRGTLGFLSGSTFQNDSFPTYSPTGRALAYFRTQGGLDTNFIPPRSLQSTASLRVIRPDGVDQSVFDFRPGLYPTGISWSPDGTQLAVGIGTQLSSGGLFQERVVPGTSEIVVLNADGSGIRQLVPSPASAPVWLPTMSVSTPGDFNGDGSADAADIDLLSNAVGGSNLVFDINSDGRVTSADREFWVVQVRGSLFGDADLNGRVEFPDFLALSNGFGSPGGWASGDFDGNGDVAFPDFLILSQNFGATAGTASVPEPNSAVVFWLAMLSLLIYRRSNV